MGRVVEIASAITGENVRLADEVKKVRDQLVDAQDEIYALGVKIRERDEIIAELQQLSSMRRTGR